MNYRTTRNIRRALAIAMLALIAILFAMIPAIGLAEAETGAIEIAAETITEPLTWEYLATVGGCALFVLVVVQLTKSQLDKLVKVSTALYAYVLAVLTMILATAFTSGLTPSSALLTLFNGWIVASTASRTYDALAGKKD